MNKKFFLKTCLCLPIKENKQTKQLLNKPLIPYSSAVCYCSYGLSASRQHLSITLYQPALYIIKGFFLKKGLILRTTSKWLLLFKQEYVY